MAAKKTANAAPAAPETPAVKAPEPEVQETLPPKFKTLKAATTIINGVAMMAISNIRILPQYNVRTQAEMDVTDILPSIKNGGVQVPVALQLIDGYITLRRGHRRLSACEIANGQGAKITHVPFDEYRGNDLDADYDLVLSNEGKPLGQLSRAYAYRRLMGKGQTIQQISERLGCSQQHIRDCIILLDQPQSVIDLLSKDKISGNTVKELARQHKGEPTAVAKAVDKLVTKAAASGKKKVRKGSIRKVEVDDAESVSDRVAKVLAKEGVSPNVISAVELRLNPAKSELYRPDVENVLAVANESNKFKPDEIEWIVSRLGKGKKAD